VIRQAYLVVVDVLLTVDGLGGLDVLLWADLLLNDLWGDLSADLNVSFPFFATASTLTSVESALLVPLRKSLTPEEMEEDIVN